MAIELKELNGEDPGTAVTVADLTFATADAHYPSSLYDIAIPVAGMSFSFWKVLYFYNSGASGLYSSIKVWSDGSSNYGNGVSINVATYDSYMQARGVGRSTGEELPLMYTDFFSYTSGSPLLVPTTTQGVGRISDYVYLQMFVQAGAVPNEPLPSEQFHWEIEQV
jgi:hypothetical protein